MPWMRPPGRMPIAELSDNLQGDPSSAAKASAVRSAPPEPSFLTRLGVFGFDRYEPVVLAALVSEDPLLLIGRSGTGKTYLLNSLSEALELEHRHYNASLISFDDLVGFPYPDPESGGVKFLETPATVWGAESVLIDEVSRCKPEHQNRLFSLVHERRVQGIPLPRLRYRWAAMNPPSNDQSGVELLVNPNGPLLDLSYAMVGRGRREGTEFFAHPAMLARYPATRITQSSRGDSTSTTRASPGHGVTHPASSPGTRPEPPVSYWLAASAARSRSSASRAPRSSCWLTASSTCRACAAPVAVDAPPTAAVAAVSPTPHAVSTSGRVTMSTAWRSMGISPRVEAVPAVVGQQGRPL